MQGRVLAQFIQLSLYDQKRPQVVNLQNNKISQIGIVPNQFASQVHTLNLRNNQFKNIQGIAQFTSLQFLDLSCNKIASSQSLLELKSLLNLKRLYLKGNPFLQNPLTQQILTFLGGFENDLQILNFAFVNESREALINKHKRSKSQSKIQSSKLSVGSKESQNSKVSGTSKISDKSEAQSSKAQQPQIPTSKSMQISKYVQSNKANILLNNMKEFIQEGHESQQMSSESINGQAIHEESLFVSDDHTFSHQGKVNDSTPIKKNLKFNSFAADDKTFSQANQTTKFQQDSTGFKGKNFTKSKATLLNEQFQSNQESGQATLQKFTELRSLTNQSLSHDFKKSQEKQFKYNVDNLNIKMQMDSVNLNCPSIIEKQDQDSYEIQFDFMSPERLSRKKLVSPRASPSLELKEITSSYMKIDDQEITLNANENSKRKQQFSKQFKSPRMQNSKMSSNTLRSLVSQKKDPEESKSISKRVEKENMIQNGQKRKSQPTLSKRGSLHESTRHLIPQTNKSTANELIGKILSGRQQKAQNDSVSFSMGTSLEQMLENGQKFERFYYNSLTRLKPVFNLLYSPFSSLNADEKDMLLQELFKNHKQIFILFLREFNAKQKLQEELHFKKDQIHSQNEEMQQLNEKIQFLGDKLNQYKEKYDHLQSTISGLVAENSRLKKQSNQFEDILATRQKIINDVKLEYEKANKVVMKKDHLIQKFLNQDQIEQQIQHLHQKRIKTQFLNLINKKAFKVMKLHQFQRKRNQKEQRKEQKRNNQLKLVVFEAFMKNYHKQKGLKDLLARTNFNTLNDFFSEWKIQVHLAKASAQVQKIVNDSRKKEVLKCLWNFNLSKQRNKKITHFRQMKLKRKIFFQGLKKFRAQLKTHQMLSLTKAVKFNTKNFLKQYFNMLKLSKSIFNEQLNQNEQKIKPIIVKRELNLFRRIVRFQKKQEELFSQKVKFNIIKHMESKLLIKIMKAQCQKNSRFRKGLKIAINYRLKKLFKGFKSVTQKTIKKYTQVKPFIYQFAQQQRLKALVVQFRQNTLRQKIRKQQKQLFFESFHKFHFIKAEYSLKQTELQCFLNFRRGFKAKNNFISTLRHMNVLRKINSKELTLSDHYKMQDLKYKQGHQLNMFTLDHLKAQVNTYLNEIQCYKVQVQILAQRQQFILDQKQNCLLEMQSKDQENLELKTILIENEKTLNDLEKKYEKSLDMYAVAMAEAQQKYAAFQKGKSSFLYDTIAGTRTPATFRRDAKQTTFTSLKR